MAGEELLNSIAGLKYNPLDTWQGRSSAVIGNTMPQLINPYEGAGTNLGVAIGGALLQGLLANQAERSAISNTIEANRQAIALQGKAPAERLSLIESLNNPQLQNRLLNYNTGLTSQEDATRRAIENKKREFAELAGLQDVEARKREAQFYATPEGQQALQQEFERKRQAALINAQNAGAADIARLQALDAFYETETGMELQARTNARLEEQSRAKGAGVTERMTTLQEARDKAKEKSDKFRLVSDELKKREILSDKEGTEIATDMEAANSLEGLLEILPNISLAQIKVSPTGLSVEGYPGFNQELERIQSQYRKGTSGLTLTDAEKASADRVFGQNMLASKEDVIAAFAGVRRALLNKNKLRLQMKLTPTSKILSSLQEAEDGGRFELDTIEPNSDLAQRATGVGSGIASALSSEKRQNSKEAPSLDERAILDEIARTRAQIEALKKRKGL